MNPSDFLEHGPADHFQRYLLLVLALEANADGLVAMPVERMATLTGMHRKTCLRCLDGLIEGYWLEQHFSGALKIGAHTRTRARDSSPKTIYRHISSTSMPYKEKRTREAESEGPVEVPYENRRLSEEQIKLNLQGIAFARERLGKARGWLAENRDDPDA